MRWTRLDVTDAVDGVRGVKAGVVGDRVMTEGSSGVGSVPVRMADRLGVVDIPNNFAALAGADIPLFNRGAEGDRMDLAGSSSGDMGEWPMIA